VARSAIIAITLPVRAQPPAPQPTFRGGTDLVQVDVSVLDGKRHLVRELTAADFSILEDGQPVAVNGASRTASVFTYLTVPCFAAAPLSLSNIVVGATARTLTAPKNFLSTLLPLVPTARREFAPADRFVAFFRIYQGTGRDTTLTPVQLQSTLIDAHGARSRQKWARALPGAPCGFKSSRRFFLR
jgi:hypothetical protein